MYRKIANKYTKLKRYVAWLYRLYELNTQIAICEPWEKVFCHVLLGSCISLILYATYAYVPSYCLILMSYLMPVSMSPNYTYSHIEIAEADGMWSHSESYIT